MREDKVPEDIIKEYADEEWRHKNQRPTKQQKKDLPKFVPAFCIGALDLFINSNPDLVHFFHEELENESGRVSIPFATPSAMDKALELELPSFLMDFTFNTNVDGLLLGAICPVGVHVGHDGLPHMKFLLTIFLVSNAEDEDRQRLLVRLFLGLRGGHRYTDAFLDMACLKGTQAEVGDKLHLHRCLQHTKTDIRK